MSPPVGDPDLDAAAAVMSRHLGDRVVLEPTSGPRGRHRSSVVRCRVLAGAAAPTTVIVKQSAGEPAGAHLALSNEWAALAFLSQLELDPPVAPAFYGGDVPARLLLLEDLGDGDDLASLLLGSDPAKAEAALIGLARALGRMHAASIGRLGEYRRLRSRLGPAGGEAIIEPGALAARFKRALRLVGLPLAAAGEEVERVTQLVTQPDSFLAFVHGDACPSNERLLGEEVVLLDFGTGGLRHALLDGVCGRVPFPTCWCARRLPPQLPVSMEESYRSELVQRCPAAADDARFAVAAATACAYWLIETTTVALASLSSGDSIWGTSTIGERLTLRAELFAEQADETGRYSALAGVLTRLVTTLGLAEVRMPLYPAFGDPALSAASP